MTGITGVGARRDRRRSAAAVDRIKAHTDLPVCVGFGVKTAEQAATIGARADGVVVGTAIVNAVATRSTRQPGPATPSRPWRRWSAGLRQGVRAARLDAAE